MAVVTIAVKTRKLEVSKGYERESIRTRLGMVGGAVEVVVESIRGNVLMNLK